MIYKYNNKFLDYSRENRKTQTDAEKLLWFQIRNRQFNGYKFRRQFPVGKYILDFYCDEKKLAVEVDGGQHNQSNSDRERDQYIKDFGIKTLRFWDNDILQNVDSVLENILQVLEEK